MSEIVVVLVTAPSGKSEEIARELVGRRLAACANIVSGVKSIYWWKGEVTLDSEDLIVIKTKKCLLNRLKTAIKEFHPYEVPEIVAVKTVDIDKEYLKWVLEETEKCLSDD
jgi:periplasmic divalent cation tolerance protein